MTSFIALIRKEHHSDYGVEFPDFPGCISAGSTLEEAKDLAREALDFHIKGMVEDKETIPYPSTLDQVMSSKENQKAVAFLVDIYFPKERVRRINITLPEDIIQKIDKVSNNRSHFITQAAKEKLTLGQHHNR
ncbi:hypothetical protein COMNV_00385 [Commensalibacter sp. Nvir]|uniref:type II toxin-antitoxin system HicB family antitoxin n=1 Tax=Commensalibacter sp. Nvir TaxID=3069817 RepID=UPI002D372971|nr:hypothetical protein COMNV_00385 [Commensalibacter sp. Nvir]